MFEILYDNQNPFDGLAPTPIVSRSVAPVHYLEKHGEVESFRLDGYITGECSENNFSGLYTNAETLINRFCSQFKRFQIIENIGDGRTGHIIDYPSSMVRNITIEDSPFSSYLPFTVNLDVYPESSFANFGIWEPRQEISFKQNEDGTVSVSKNVGARGFNTDLPALENAINFVDANSGWNDDITPLFISSGTPILLTETRNIDRANGAYSISQEFVYQSCGDRNLEKCFLQYTVDSSSGVEGSTVKIEGNIRGGAETTLQNLRDSFASLDFLAIAESEYPLSSFYDSPSSKSISENIDEKTISFSFVFVDFITSDPYIMDSFSVSFNSSENKKCASANVEIRSNIGCKSERWAKINQFRDNFDMREWMQSRYEEYVGEGEIGGSFVSFGKSSNENNLSVGLSATLCEKKIQIPEGLEDIVFSVQISPAMPKFAPFQGLDCLGAVTVQKMQGLTRRNVSISGYAVMLPCAEYDDSKDLVKNYINSIKEDYLNEDDAFLTQYSINQGSNEDSQIINFSFSWSELGEQVLPNSVLHS